MSSYTKSKEFKANLFLFSCTVIWGLTFIVTKNALEAIPVYSLIFFRFFLAFIGLTVIFYKKIKFDLMTIITGIFLGIFLFFSFVLQTFSLKYVDSSIVAFLSGFSVIFVPLILYIFFKIKITILIIVSAIVSLVGLKLLTGSNGETISFGEVMAILSTLFIALHIVYTDKFSHKYEIYTLVFFEFLTVAILSLIFSLIYEPVTLNIDFLNRDFLIATIFNAIFATLYCFMIQTSMQRYTTPSKTAIIFIFEPLFGAIFGFLIGGDSFTNMQIMGGVLIVSSMIIGEIKIPKKV